MVGGLLAVALLTTFLGHVPSPCHGGLWQGKPPKGWNSYDGFTCTVTEEEVRVNAALMASELSRFGYEYVTIDYEWFRPGTGQFSCCGRNPWQDLVVDKFGRALPSPDRYPSAKDSADSGMPGFGPLATYVHALGLKFGIHIMRGIPRVAVDKNMPIFGSKFTARDAAGNKTYCSWCDDMSGIADNAAGQAYYDSLIQLYAEWGVDFVKMDCAFGPTYKSEILQISKSISSQSRDIILSMSPTNRDPNFAAEVKEHVSMYRINGDVWDNWANIDTAFATAPSFQALIGAPSYPDLDMLPLGRLSIRGGHGPNRTTALSADEQHTMMNLWAMFRNPLMMGGDLRYLADDRLTMELLTNEEILNIQSNTVGNRPIRASANYINSAAITEVISVEKCIVGERSQQWGSVSTTTDGSLPNHATFSCLTLLNCSLASNATIGAERCHVGTGCEDGVNQVWEVGRDGYIDTPMNHACLTATATTLPCNVTAMAKNSSLEQLQVWKRNQTDNSLHHLASGGCLTSTLSRQTGADATVAAWTAHAETDEQTRYVALFNLDDHATVKVSASFSEAAVSAKSCDVMNIWTREVTAAQTDFSADLAPHASVVYRVDTTKCK